MRAALLAVHVLAVALLALPGASISSARGLKSRTVQADIADWAGSLGVEPAELTGWLRSLIRAYVGARWVLKPFERYAQLTGAKQGWAMFASPQRHPSELHIEGRVGDGPWELLYRPHDDKAAFMADFLRHNRVRKFSGRFARSARRSNYEGLADYVARRACEEREDLTEVRVALWSYRALDRAAVARGERPKGSHEKARTHTCPAPGGAAPAPVPP